MVVSSRQWVIQERNAPFVVPSFETISFSLPSMASWEELLRGEQDAWVYLSDGNPTLATLESLLAKVQGTEKCWVTSTGKSAIAACLLALLKAGDNLVLLQEGYKSTRLFAQGVLQRLGVNVTLVKVDDLCHLREILEKTPTAVMVLEAPTNPMTRVPDLLRACAIAQEHNVLTILDNSLAGFHQHSQIPVDLFVHSLSKYASGVGDVMGGAVLGSKEMVSRVKNANVWNTDTLSSHSALEIWKGMQTYDLRIERQSSNALAIARFLEGHPRVKRVLYPGLESHPDYQTAKKQMRDFGSVLAFDTSNASSMRSVLDGMKQFRIAFGTGFTQSIANPAWLFYARSFPEVQHGNSAILDSTIRLSVGIEDVDLLISDLERALAW